tara:strand:- start:5306 stop:7216 length:1911 start_codon:yes stop_codon:yes gene_type:complete
MKFIYKDLLNFLAEKPSKDLLSEKLFQLGHEHEIVGDIFNMELTPNRGDCLSLKGLARDLNIFFGKAEHFKIFEGAISALHIDFKNLSVEDCPKISFLEIEIEDISNAYKPYLENYFSLLSNNKTNFFTDISNYISYELGQPTHCYEADSINNKLIFENRTCEESFKSLLGSNIDLSGDNCVFSIDNEVVSLAGVMGGISTACSTKTKKALVECAFFKPEAIIGKSVKYNLTSDAAHKFERGVDINSQENVLRRFIEIVNDHAEIKNIKIQSFGDNQVQKGIAIDVNKINKILGTDIDEKEYLTYLTNLDFSIEKEIIIPAHRHDIASQNDLAEEVARIVGYNNIESRPLKIIKADKNISKASELKIYLIKNGFSEVINFPFIKNKDKKSISIDNPLDSNRNYLRTSLKDSLLENLLYNERRQKDSIKLFEISDIYYHDNGIKSKKMLGIICSGRVGRDLINFSKKLDKTYLIKILNKFLINKDFNPELITRDGFQTKLKNEIIYIEIELDSLDLLASESQFVADSKKEDLPNFIKYDPISEFPSSYRDLSFSVSNVKSYNQLQEFLLSYDNNLIKEIFTFDFFINKKSNEIKIGFRIIFQSINSTMTDKQINEIMDKIITTALNIKHVSIPGLVK